MKRRTKRTNISSETTLKVRFNEVDSLQIVWHGHYVNYFEDGRRQFGRDFELGYMDIFNAGYTAPIVEFDVKNLASLAFGDEAIVKIFYVESSAAKLIFDYEIIRARDGVLAAKGRTIQVFVNFETKKLELYYPQFFLDWKEKMTTK